MGKKILIVDDAIVMRTGFKGLFSKSPYWSQIIEASNGKEAIEKIFKYKPDIVLMDVEMPVMDGLTALRHITKLKREGRLRRNLPIVILSATMYQNDDNVRKAKLFGAAAVVAKPDGQSVTFNINFKALETKLLKLIG